MKNPEAPDPDSDRVVVYRETGLRGYECENCRNQRIEREGLHTMCPRCCESRFNWDNLNVTREITGEPILPDPLQGAAETVLGSYVYKSFVTKYLDRDDNVLWYCAEYDCN